MNAENNHTAETEKEHSKNGTDTITIQATLGDEDDVHKCGRCQSEFFSLEGFIQHKLQQSCVREETREAFQEVSPDKNNSSSEVKTTEEAPTEKSPDDQSSDQLGRGHRKRTVSHKVTETNKEVGSGSGEEDKQSYKLNEQGRYVCSVCENTFKTTNILRTHMKIHSDKKKFACELCDTLFRTKGSLIRHMRRHTDERPYRCSLCGQSFRESGALTRHLKALTPCTEKIRFVQYKEILVSKDGVQKGVVADRETVAAQQEVVVVEQQPEEEEVVEAQTAIVSVVDAGSQEVLQQVHFTMEVDQTAQEQQVLVEQSQADALAADSGAGDSLICQAIINSGIALGTEEAGVEEAAQTPEELEKMDSEQTGAEQNVIEIQVKEVTAETEDSQQETEDEHQSSNLYTCPYCNRSFKGVNYFRFHVKCHFGYTPFKCTICNKEFLTGYLLKKHMEVHVSERRYKCGECGKLYKTIGHVREHMRAHSDERPYHCNRCNKGYKTKNALQVHQRTHGDEKPYVCKFCFRSFREKGSLVRHIRHHTGEKPFKCLKCGRGFAEHGTLNRHMRAKGGCQKENIEHEGEKTEEQASVDGLVDGAVITDDADAVLVEFSSVVADTQEYIIKTQTDEETQEEVTVIEERQNEVGNQIMQVVQQIVSQSRGTGSHQIIVRNVAANEDGPSISDCGDTITIATPESLTEQVAMTLASAISDGTLLATSNGSVEAAGGTVTMVTTGDTLQEGMQVVQQQEEFVITSPEVEYQTVVV